MTASRNRTLTCRPLSHGIFELDFHIETLVNLEIKFHFHIDIEISIYFLNNDFDLKTVLIRKPITIIRFSVHSFSRIKASNST